MLKEIFFTEPFPYLKHGDPHEPGYFVGWHYHPEYGIYAESFLSFMGIHVGRQLPDAASEFGDVGPDSPTSIYVWFFTATDWWPSWGFSFYRVDGKSGKLTRRIYATQGGLYALMTLNYVTTSRRGSIYATDYYNNGLFHITLGKSARAMAGTTVVVDEPWSVGPEGQAPGVQGWGAGFFEGNVGFTSFIIDDTEDDTFVQVWGWDLTVWKWSTGKFRYSVPLPGLATSICLEDNQRCYVLMQDRTVMLFDYQRGEVLGAVKIPPLSRIPAPTAQAPTPSPQLLTGGMIISWDPVFRRLLVGEMTPDDPNHASTTIIRGFRMVPEPTRLTRPLPLRPPRQRRVVPFLVQAVGDLNEGVGGYAIKATVTGAGSLAGIPTTDHRGNALIQVACEGERLFAGSEGDWASTGSPEATPPHAGLVNIAAKAYAYQPDKADIFVSGLVEVEPGKPGAPSGDTGGGSLPSEAPNMLGTLQSVLSSGHWNLSEGNEDAPNGRGAYTEAVVTALHDQDARWGHIDKNPGQNQYNGHAVDAIIFKNDDGTTAEIFDIVTGSGDIMWGFSDRTAANRDKWRYPAGS